MTTTPDPGVTTPPTDEQLLEAVRIVLATSTMRTEVAADMIAHALARQAGQSFTMRRAHQMQAAAMAAFAEELERAGHQAAADMADKRAAGYTTWAAEQ